MEYTLIGAIAHDVKSPLRVLNGLATILKEDISAGEPVSSLISTTDNIIKVTNQLGALIDGLISLENQTCSGDDFRVINLSDLARDILHCLDIDWIKTQILIEPNLYCRADQSVLRVLLGNLFSNALKFSCMVDSPIIRFGLDLGRQAYFVQDNGIGFPDSCIPHLFTPFKTFHPEYSGTGLGLSLAQKAVMRHNGNICIQRSQEHTTVYFTLGV